MGYNTVVVVMNDAMDAIVNDPEFGRNLALAALRVGVGGVKFKDVQAGSHVNAATVLSCQHADIPQLSVVQGNFGVVDRYGEEPDETLVTACKDFLERAGYSVRRKPIKK